MYRDGLISGQQSILAELEGATVYHIDLEIGEDPRQVSARQEILYTNTETEPLEELYFYLYPTLLGGRTEIFGLEVDGLEVDPSFELNETVMRVPLPQAIQPGQRAVVRMDFDVTVPEDAERNYMMFALADDILALAHFYPTLAVYDDEGWNVQVPSELGDVVYADSSFYVVRVEAPEAMTLVASGSEIDRQRQNGRQQVTYAGGPMRDFYLAGSDRFGVVSEKTGETTVNSYAPVEFLGAAETILGQTADSLEAFGSRFGPYPFSEFDVVSTPTLALGIEYPGATAIALRMYDPETNPYPPQVLESTVAHEVAHQWSYSMVGNDQLDEPWVDEALAQYLTMLYWADLYGPSAKAGFRQSLEGRWARVDKEEIPIGMPVGAYDNAEYGAIVYGRGPLFVEALEGEMGAEVFADFLREYYSVHKWGVASTESFRQLAEEHCNCELAEIFEQWVY